MFLGNVWHVRSRYMAQQLPDTEKTTFTRAPKNRGTTGTNSRAVSYLNLECLFIHILLYDLFGPLINVVVIGRDILIVGRSITKLEVKS